MKIIRIFNRGVKDGFKSIFRNFSLSLASISSAAITLIIVAIAIVFTYNVNSITKNIENDLNKTMNEITLFLFKSSIKNRRRRL